MKTIVLFLLVTSVLTGNGTKLPDGVTMDSIPCSFAKGKFSYSFFKNNEMIGQITSGTCHFDNLEDGKPDNNYYVDFYMDYKKETLASKQEAIQWMENILADYYKPVVFSKWKSLKVQPPNVTLKYPWDWTYRLDKYQGIFESKIQSENKLTIIIEDQRGHSEILMLIRTPNTAKLSVNQVMEMNANMNRAINFQSSPAVNFAIGGKSFKSSQNTFMGQMDQYHFWYADEQEIIYLNYNLLKDEKVKYPEVMKEIVNSIQW